jgi:hypothetical protein
VPGSEDIRQKLASWLFKQKSPHWSFNYWAKDAPERESMSYPDDLDDTFCALIALKKHAPELIDESCLARVVKLLIAAETKPGGPYRTWLVAKTAEKIWQDVDLAVNANVYYFLKLIGSELPNLTAMIENAIDDQNFRSPYYPSAFPVIYYVARSYDGPRRTKLIRYLKSQETTNALDLALTVSVMGGKDLSQSLIDQQRQDGSWPAEAFCLDPAIKNKKYYSGSSALSTALALEALAGQKTSDRLKPRPKAKSALHQKIVTAAQKELSALDSTLKDTTIKALERVADEDITLLAERFNQSLVKPVHNKNLIFHLGLANLYGWAAYSIFDDFLDDEGSPKFLPAATLSLRYSLRHFRLALPDNKSFQVDIDRIFDVIDAANAWEVEYARLNDDLNNLPKYGSARRLAERSLGHALPILGVLAARGTDTKSKGHIEHAVSHYLVARQLNDDLHDWESDFKAGCATFVVTEILKKVKEPVKMQPEFWHNTLPAVCKVIGKHTAAARASAEASRLMRPVNIFSKLVGEIDLGVAITLREHSQAKSFLSAYRMK